MSEAGTDGVSDDALPRTADDGPAAEGEVGVVVEHAATVNEHQSHTRMAQPHVRGLPVAARRAKPIRPF